MIPFKKKIEIDKMVDRYKKNRNDKEAIKYLDDMTVGRVTGLRIEEKAYAIEQLFEKIPDLSPKDFDRLNILEEVGMSAAPTNTTANIPNPAETMQGATSATSLPQEPMPIIKEDGEFLGNPVFDVDSDTFASFRTGKNRYHRWDKYMNMTTEKNKGIYEYCKKNHKKSIILRDDTGAMIYARPDKHIR